MRVVIHFDDDSIALYDNLDKLIVNKTFKWVEIGNEPSKWDLYCIEELIVDDSLIYKREV